MHVYDLLSLKLQIVHDMLEACSQAPDLHPGLAPDGVMVLCDAICCASGNGWQGMDVQRDEELACEWLGQVGQLWAECGQDMQPPNSLLSHISAVSRTSAAHT